MSDILKVSQPVNPSFENNNVNNNPIIPGDKKIQNIVDPSKVVRSDGKTENEDSRFQLNTGSNFEGFMKLLNDTPHISELLTKFLFFDMKSLISSGLGEDFAAQISQFMEMMSMDGDQLLTFIKDQMLDSKQLGGVFFQALGDVLNNTQSLDLKTGILAFIKKYNDIASSDHLLEMILIESKAMLPYMFKKDADKLEDLLRQLIPQKELFPEKGGDLLNIMGDAINKNSSLLKDELLPFFSRYIGRTHDLGKVRDLMTLVTLHISRYANGSKEGLVQSFERLLKYQDFSSKFSGLQKDNMTMILNNLLAQKKMGESSVWTEKFLGIVDAGVNGAGGYENKAVFLNIMNSILLNESVYMPLLHLMIPVTLNGNIMFSELWIDPDAERESQSGKEKEKAVRLLVKFDIKDLGFFDVILNYWDGKVDLQVFYPERLAAAEKEIRSGLSTIVTDNGFSFENFMLQKSIKPRQLTEVFPKIAEGRNSVNVRI